jgi:UDP-2,3-diacylglucosamine hydrolase
VQFCNQTLQKEHYDYFIFGHRHLALDLKMGQNSRYINLGAWFKNPHYAVWDGQELKLEAVSNLLLFHI